MKSLLLMLVSITIFYLSLSSADDSIKISSTNTQNVLIELFTSQGCSSCPPAENWLNTYKNNANLWTEIVPIAFHVDYWDRLGWPDPFANHAYSMRQYRHQQENNISSVYTPGVVVNGREWRGWIRGKDFPMLNQDAGVLSLQADSQNLLVTYSKSSKEHVLNVALLGMGIVTKIELGENRGKNLHQEFVVLSHNMYSVRKSHDLSEWTVPLPKDHFSHASRHAIAIWVAHMDDITPIQATGYWIPSEWVIIDN